jgi:hypothetical protein
MNRETVSGAGAPSFADAIPFGGFAASPPDNVIQLDSCSVFQWIVVTTRQSVYDIIVLSGDAGKVMVRGGCFFPEFRHATIAGSTFGGSAAKLGSICVGLHLEIHVDGKSFVTSRIRTVSLGPPQR